MRIFLAPIYDAQIARNCGRNRPPLQISKSIARNFGLWQFPPGLWSETLIDHRHNEKRVISEQPWRIDHVALPRCMMAMHRHAIPILYDPEFCERSMCVHLWYRLHAWHALACVGAR